MDVARNPASFCPSLSLEQKWDLLKPEIEELYVEQGFTLRKVVEHMKAQYNFDANEFHYKYRIKIWGLKKNVSATKKRAMNDRVLSQSRGSPIGVAKYKGRAVPERKLRRQARTDLRQSRPVSQRHGDRFDCNLSASIGRIFKCWNVPYKPSKAPAIGLGNHPSPFPPQGSTPSDVSFGSPQALQNGAGSGLTPSLSSALQKKISLDRARLFLDGKLPDIIESMTQEEQMTMSTWLYQLWFFSFKTSKYWGKGPRHWTADYLGFRKGEVLNFPTPASQDSPATTSPGTALQNSPSAREERVTNTEQLPSQLCRWSIHVREETYIPLPDPLSGASGSIDVNDPATYQPWSPSDLSDASYPNTIRDALESNDFSNLRSDQLPVSVPQMLQKAVRQEGDLVTETLAFAIISRNVEAVNDFGDKSLKTDERNDILKAIDAFHLAAAYLDGAKTCCVIMNELNNIAPLRRHYINSLGHTVLDTLMITIIKSHTTCKPESVDDTFQGTHRFPGEDMDICGRWDADSDCVRKLLLGGKHRIPFNWKHKFCHTSAQAICDVVICIWGSKSAPSINTSSGLFVKRCLHCGLKMQLGPLHALVLVMYHLSIRGCEGEDLFGTTATLLCLLRNGADANLKCSLAVASLMSNEKAAPRHPDPDTCQHESIDALQLAKEVLQQCQSLFIDTTIVGWNLCIEILVHAKGEQEGSTTKTSDEGEEPDLCDEVGETSDEDHDTKLCNDCKRGGTEAFWQNQELGVLWAIFHAELATYRRISTADSWTSANVNLEAMLVGLATRSAPNIKLIRGNMIKPSCRCGAFVHQNVDHNDVHACINPADACEFYFSNMEDWSRSSFLTFPERNEWSGEENLIHAMERRTDNQEVMGDNSGPSNTTVHTHNADQASGTADSSEQVTDTFDQPMNDQLPGPSEVGALHTPEVIDVDDPAFYGAISPSFIRTMESQQQFSDFHNADPGFDDDMDMYGAG